MKPLKLYFAHNFNDRLEFRLLELRLERELGIQLYNPFYDDLTRKKEMAIIDADNSTYVVRIKNARKSPTKTETEKQLYATTLVQKDLTALASCDGLFTIIKKPSIGTTIEICNAKLMCKPVWVVSDIYMEHPWIRVYADYRFRKVEDFVKFLKREGSQIK